MCAPSEYSGGRRHTKVQKHSRSHGFARKCTFTNTDRGTPSPWIPLLWILSWRESWGCGAQMGHFGANLVILVPTSFQLGLHVGSIWPQLRPTWAILAPTWSILGPTWYQLDPNLAHLGLNFAQLDLGTCAQGKMVAWPAGP